MRAAVVVVVALALLAAGCARPPRVLRGSFAPVSPRDAQVRGALGERVRWGGKIVDTTPGKDQTCFEILSQPLDGAAHPVETDETYGRFVACAPGFYDPAVYAPERQMTVVGTVAEPMMRRVGDYEYEFPVVNAETLYLWPKREERIIYYDPWGPFWGPYPFGVWGAGGSVAVPVPACPPMRHR